MGNVLITAPSENEVLTKIEAISDVSIRNAMLALFWWRMGTQEAVAPAPKPQPSS